MSDCIEKPTLVAFRLEPAGDRSVLALTEPGFDKVPASRRAEAFRMNDDGWTQQMQNIQRPLEAHQAG